MSAPALSYDPADAVDRLLFFTGGEVLRVGHAASGGELDSYRGGSLSTRTLRRLAGAQLVSSAGGLEPDRLQQEVVGLGRCHLVDSMTPDAFVSWYVGEALAGLDYRAAVRAGGGVGVQVRPPTGEIGEVPRWASDWLIRLVHGPKAEYVAELIAWAWGDELEPVTPATGWGVKTRGRFDSRVRRAARVECEQVAS